MILKPPLSLVLIWLMLVTALPLRAADTLTKQDNSGSVEQGLRVRLSEVTESVVAQSSTPSTIVAEKLSEPETRKLLGRLPFNKQETSDVADFKLRERSLLPPRTGETIQSAFTLSPPTVPSSPATNLPLEVTRFSPVGEVELAPNLAVTFSQPMIEVSSQAQAAANVPITLAPQPTGKWRWLGTQTVMFQPEAEGGRLPMATTYVVTIPAGTKSALGNALRETKTFTFATPPPQLKSSYPEGESKPRDMLMLLEFDQRIEPARVLEHLKLQPTATNTRLRLATPEEIAADGYLSDFVKRAQDGRWMVVRAVDANGSTRDALPIDTVVKVLIPAGTPSGEGPRTTVAEQSFTFRTFGPFRIVDSQCGYQKRCAPSDHFRVTFNNQLAGSLASGQIKITPEIPDARITPYYNGVMIEGVKRSNTKYTVTFDPTIKDVFNQTLTGNNQVSFQVTTEVPALVAQGGNLIVVDPAGPRVFSVYSRNHSRLRVALYKVTPDDWRQFRIYQGARYSNPQEPPLPPGRLVSDKVIEITNAPDQLIETAIDLSPALDERYGHAFVRVETVGQEVVKDQSVNIYANQQNLVEAWIQSTDIALDAFADKDELVVWTNSLTDGRPLANVEVSVAPDDVRGVSGSDGLTRLPFKDSSNTKQNQLAMLVARRGKDVAFLQQADVSPYSFSEGYESRSWRSSDARQTNRWYVFDDRKLYRPGEEVNIKGWIRQVNLTPTGDTEMYTPGPDETLNYVLEDSQDNELAKGSTKLNALAGFNIKVQLPPTMHLGEANIRFVVGDSGTEHTHTFQVQEFRRPEFEVTTRASEAPHFVGGTATVTMTAAYYTGGGLAGTDVDWTVTSTETNYTPPNRSDYTFGEFIPWWTHYGGYRPTNQQTFKGRTDANGKHTLKLDFEGVRPARPSSVSVASRVQDVNRQTISGYTSLLVHPADVYVGIRSARSFVQRGEVFDIATIVTDLDGKALAGRDVLLRLVPLDYFYESATVKREIEPQEQTVKSGADAVHASFQALVSGRYLLTAQVRDDRERVNESQLSLWVAGGNMAPNGEMNAEKVELIPDRRTYADKDVAEILVQSPFVPAEGVMTIRRSGLLSTQRFTMNESSYTLRVPIAEAMTPNVTLQVDLVGAATRVNDKGEPQPTLPKRPAFASGEIKLDVPPVMRRLSVTATPRKTVLEPGSETLVDVEVKDVNGQGVPGTDTAVIVVDESVLALANYKIPDPLSYFYSDREENVNDHHLRKFVLLANPEDTVRPTIAGGVVALPLSLRLLSSNLEISSSVMESVSLTGADQIATRKNFNALAVFAASLPTDASGRVQLKIKLPDNLTRYRVTAVSVAGGKLSGFGESAITARKQLMARPSAPRFLNYGDTAELPVVLQNQTDQAMNVSVAVRAANANLTEGAGRRVSVPANNRVEVRFPIAAVKPGTARFQIVAASEANADAAEISLPVYTPATTEAFATYGVIDNGSIVQPVRAPADAVKTFGGLEVTTTSTQLQELTDAAVYLINYPYSCSEQKASRIIAIAALKDILTAFKSENLPASESLRDSVNADVRLLQELQNEDGGFAFWKKGDPSFPFVSVHVAHALVRAKGKGFAVPEQTLLNSQNYLRGIERKIPADYSVESRRAIQAYALYVRALMGDIDPAGASKLIADAGGVEKLSIESLGWLLRVVSGDSSSTKETEAIRRHLNNRVTETAGAAHFADSYSDGAYTILHSDRRADGVILDALIGDQPQSDLIPKLVRGLLSGRKRGRWLNTQENVFILLALDRYFNTYERTTPDFVARVWLGNGYAGEQTFKGRSVDRQQLNLPMSTLVERTAHAPANLTIAKEGAGRLYFRIGTKYAPSNLKIAAADYGFEIKREYEAIDNPADVQREADGAWLIKAGARVRVRVTMSNPALRYHVALVDPLPAGLEPLNPALATTERLPAESSEAAIKRGGRGIYEFSWYWRGTWYEHQNLRDERAEAFTSMLWEGVHEYTYFARATTPGLFIVPPAKAEEMYAPETFGRGQSDRVRVR